MSDDNPVDNNSIEDDIIKTFAISNKCTSFLAIIVAIIFVFILENDKKMIVKGTGNHNIIMLHGMGGNVGEFYNLYPLFDEKNYTIIIPNDIMNPIMGLRYSVNIIYNQIKDVICNNIKNITDPCRISIIGNSLGGLVAKLLIIKIHNEGLMELREMYLQNIEYKNFITVVTPHMGISFPKHYSFIDTLSDPLNYIRIVFSYFFLFWTGDDLRTTNLLNQTETPEFLSIARMFDNVVSYSLSTFDSNVPFFSSSRGFVDIKKKIMKQMIANKYNYDRIDEYGDPRIVEWEYKKEYDKNGYNLLYDTIECYYETEILSCGKYV